MFRGPVKAGVAALFAVGLLLLFLNPPSLNGRRGHVCVLIGGGIVAGARRGVGDASPWPAATRCPSTSSSGSSSAARSSPRKPDLIAETDEFDLLVADAIDALPEDFQRLLDTTPVVVSQRGAENRAYGHYFGDTVARDDYPDRIVVYQDTLERDFGHDPDLLRAQVERTLRHELAHHLGWDEPGVRDLGL